MNIVQTCERTLMGWRQLFAWHNMRKWIQRVFSAFPRSLPDGNRKILVYRFFRLKFWLCLCGRIRNCYLISSSRFLDLYKFRVATLFFEYTFLVICFLGVGLSGDDDAGSKKCDTNTGLDTEPETVWGSMRERSMR